ncbi:MAG: transcriptional repressor [Candidatus Baltobacteraceae bacterium]|jgi:Fur family ferric uptake transcriptional regulator/Fur family peroxide stress response transcriptional regulator
MATLSHRLTQNDAVVLEVIRGEGEPHHLTAADIFDRLRRRHHAVGFATVHRALARLVELELVMRIDVPGRNAALYECARPAHSHFTCARCGETVDVGVTVPDSVADRAREILGAHVAEATVFFRGTCVRCRERPSPRAEVLDF